MPADDQVQQPLEVVLGDDRQVVYEDVAAEKDRARAQDQRAQVDTRALSDFVKQKVDYRYSDRSFTIWSDV